MALPQLVNNSNAAALVTASGNGEYLLSLLGFWLAFRDACTVCDLRWETSGTEGGPQVQTMGQPRRIECCAARRNSAT